MNYNTSNAKIASRKENFKCLLMKKPGTITLAAMMAVFSMNTIAFASSSLLVSEEGIGIEVHNPADFGVGEIATRGYVNDNYLTVLGGTLWTTWDGSVQLSPWLDQTLTNNQSWASTR
ncbi:hypothetical protein [Murimonas intestini]|uniref:hypothetical protein n=1 Tax=Murimonas intestini TaxID=1337051 RepID=UPI0011DC9529|nr:hypothetical protein [Murimonas intestini]